MIEAIIFDFDGVIADSEHIALTELNQTFRKFGIELGWDELVSSFLGKSPGDIVRYIEKQSGADPGKEYPQIWNDRVCNRFATDLEVVPGITNLLSHLKDIRIPTCIASGSPVERLDLALRTLGLQEHFINRSFGGDHVERGKPAPDIFQYAADKLGVSSERCVVIEDGLAGTIAARDAGVAVIIGFLGGSHLEGYRQFHGKQLIENGATHLAHSISEITPIINERL
ncbi:HAD family hydrolase [Cohaesibacter celericrescens]|nr:HAD family phosphatase [Cohaesibacter celericrescens]